MNYFMGVPEDMIQSGIAELYEDDDDSLAAAIEKYNDYEANCRIDYKKSERIVVRYCIITPILVILLTIINAAYIFGSNNRIIPAGFFYVAWLITFIVFGILKRNLLLSSLFTIPLIYLDWMFLAVVAIDAMIAFLYEKIDKPLRDNPTYPQFRTIDIKYRRGKRSEYHNPMERL